jgi:hypothetical protein
MRSANAECPEGTQMGISKAGAFQSRPKKRNWFALKIKKGGEVLPSKLLPQEFE